MKEESEEESDDDMGFGECEHYTVFFLFFFFKLVLGSIPCVNFFMTY